jgi:hypothetical protein
MLLELAEVYNSAYDLEAAERFWGEYNREVRSFEEFRTSILRDLKEPNSERFTSKFELAGILIEYGFLDAVKIVRLYLS